MNIYLFLLFIRLKSAVRGENEVAHIQIAHFCDVSDSLHFNIIIN